MRLIFNIRYLLHVRVCLHILEIIIDSKVNRLQVICAPLFLDETTKTVSFQ